MNVLIVTKEIRLCANRPFWTLFSVIQPHFMVKAGTRNLTYVDFLNYKTSEYSIFFPANS